MKTEANTDSVASTADSVVSKKLTFALICTPLLLAACVVVPTLSHPYLKLFFLVIPIGIQAIYLWHGDSPVLSVAQAKKQIALLILTSCFLTLEKTGHSLLPFSLGSILALGSVFTYLIFSLIQSYKATKKLHTKQQLNL